MASRHPATRYGGTAQAFHWLIALLVLLQFPLAFWMDRLVEPFSKQQFVLVNLHKTLGVTILLLALLRLAWRRVSPPPPLPAQLPDWERQAARASHAALYLLLIVQPLVGLAQGFVSGFPTVLFLAVTLPSPLGPDRTLDALLGTAHFLIGWSFLALVALHVAAALRHHLLLRDEVLARMLPAARHGRR
ncbi:cytochrome b561 [Tistlia consotensis]|uniref:Cytochrome b561 n=1 Tax=Tistlia consotensis USBA 355 TaxID=560819 RepID=A0A1Y6BAK6_9PROT|nr:cytochrome b/b6 domain-containing protein [Tistlia consotensis]SME97936.1 cytochrome b561 [Tistlia consotensis USBA 355]SNR57319.1 cytochrome b561 [Tistlia consotensis]